jgi:sodium transport system permease protein
MRSAAGIVCRKEIFDNARDRRTLLTALLFGPVFGPVFFAILINLTVSQTISSGEEAVRVPVVGRDHAQNLIEFFGSRNVVPIDDQRIATLEHAMAAVRAGEHDLVVVIDEHFGQDLSAENGAHVSLVYDQSNTSARSSVQRVRGAVNAYSRQIGLLRLFARGIDPKVVTPLIIDDFDVSTASGRAGVLLGMLTYFLLLSTMMGGFYLAIDSTAGERERKSLEPLLSTPVTRRSILLGKLGATIAYMLVSLALTLVCLTLVLPFLPLEELGMSSSFGPLSALFAFFILAPFAPLGAALMTAVASFTKSYKEAQGWLTVVLLVPTLPLVFASVLNVRPALELMTVPSLGQHLLVSTLIRQEPMEASWVIVSIGTTLLVSAALTLVAIKLYEREGILG